MFPVQSDTTPTQELPLGGAASMNVSTSGVGRPSAVGAYPLSQSFYGVLGMADNISEWIETINGMDRVVRSSSWSGSALNSGSNSRLDPPPGDSFETVGFRVGAKR